MLDLANESEDLDRIDRWDGSTNEKLDGMRTYLVLANISFDPKYASCNIHCHYQQAYRYTNVLARHSSSFLLSSSVMKNVYITSYKWWAIFL